MRRSCAASVFALALASTPGAAQQSAPSFFITSVAPGKGADLGGLAGADKYCTELARAAGLAGDIWHAYLSAMAQPNAAAVNARDRIGTGPWFNRAGVMIAKDLADLHGDGANLTKATILTEKGDTVNGRGDRPNRHDVLTGSQRDGTAYSGPDDTTCRNWTSGAEGSARVGHHDRQGGGEFPTSWNSAHGSRGCSQDNLRSSGGDGLFYCFRVR